VVKSSGSAVPKKVSQKFAGDLSADDFLFGIRNTALVLRRVAVYEKLQSG